MISDLVQKLKAIEDRLGYPRSKRFQAVEFKLYRDESWAILDTYDDLIKEGVDIQQLTSFIASSNLGE